MATQKTTVVVDVTDNGTTEKLNQQAQKTHKTFKDLLKTAGDIAVGGAKQALSLAKGPARVGSSAVMSEMQYGAARGSAGLTGASARDFAKQAEGLSGLVRLYAVYAANIYAAGAAFTALSRAMDTANMVQGLDQLGAASGTALGSLSKRLVDATDGAVALRDAMEATVKASSSGMNSDQILRMGKAAKLASQALGVDMNDALSRITRGITKLEPELLDELGLFIKVDDVVSNYAKSVGKSAAAVTDFEKRQAVANATLTQAEEKFSAINIDTNPYTQLTAVMKDLAQTGLELVNKVLAPIAKYLAESPNTLSVALAGMVALIVRQAVPALAEYRQSVLLATQEAAKANAERYASAKKYLSLEAATLKANADAAAEEAHRKFEESSAAIQASYRKTVDSAGRMGAKIAEIAKKDLNDITKADEKLIAEAAKRPTNIAASYAKMLGDIQRAKVEASKYVEEAARISEDYAKKEQAANEEYTSRNKKNVQDMFASNMRAQAAYIASTQGWVAALKQVSERYKELSSGAAKVSIDIDEIDASGKRVTKTVTESVPAISKVGAAMAGLGAAAAATLTKINQAAGVLGRLAEIIGIIVAVGGLLYAWLGNASKQAAETSKSIDVLESSLTNVGKTIEAISKKPAELRFDVSSISAASTAVNDLGTQLVDVFEKSYKQLEAMNWADKIVDAIMPGSVEGRLVENTAKSVEAAFKAVSENSPAGKAARESIQNILKLDPKVGLSAEVLEKALGKLSSADKKSAIDGISKAVKALGSDMQITAAKGNELVEAFKKVDDQRKKVAMSFVPKDDFTELGQGLIDSAIKLSVALDDPVQKYNALLQLAQEYPKTAGATAQVSIALQDIASDVTALNTATSKYAESQKDLLDIEAQLNALIGPERTKSVMAGNKVISAGLTGPGLDQLRGLIASLKELRKESANTKDLEVQLKLKIDSQQQLIEKTQLDIFKSGAAIISQSLSAEWAKAGATITNAYASILSGTQTGIKMRADAEKRIISAQIEQIKAQRDQILSTEKNSLAIRENTLQRKLENADPLGIPGDVLAEKDAIERAKAQIKKLEAANVSGSTQGMYSKLTKELEAGGIALTDLDRASLDLTKNLEASGAAVANLRAQMKAVDIRSADETLTLKFERRQEALKLEQERLRQQREGLALTKQAVGTSSLQLLQDEQSLEATERTIAQKAAVLAIEAKIERLRQVPGAGAEVAREKANLANLQTTQSIDDVTFRIKQKQDLIRAGLAQETDIRKKAKEAYDAQAAAQQAQLDSGYMLLELGKESTAVSATEYLNQKYILDTQQAQLDAETKRRGLKESSADKLDSLNQREGELYAAGSERNLTEAEVAALIQIREEREKILKTQSDGLTYTDRILQSNLQNLAVQKELGLVQESWNIKLKELEGFAETLKGIFGEVGAKLAEGLTGIADSLAKNALLTKQNELAVQSFGDRADEAFAKAEAAPDIASFEKFMKEGNDLLKDRAKAENKAIKDELTGNAQLAGATKKLFKEKTTAHKALAAAEKGFHVARIAMDVKETAIKLGLISQEQVASFAASAKEIAMKANAALVSIGIDIPAIYAKTIGQLGIFGPPVATAMIAAFVGSAFAKGGAGSAAFVPTSEQRQETQGTAMGWDSEGNKVQTRRGVFGDTDAKSESIANSLEVIKDTSVTGLSNDNRVVSLLSSINEGISGAAKGLYRIEGLRTGSMFGTKEGTSGGGIFSGSLGGSSSTSINDAGIIIKGTFAQLASDTNEAVLDLFEEVKKTKKSWYGKTKTSIRTLVKEIDEPISQFFSDIFSNARDLFIEVGKDASINEAAINSILEEFTFKETKYSLRDLKGAELEKEVGSIVSSMLDDAALAIFNSFEQYAEFDEGMLETVIRVTDTNKKVVQAISNTGTLSAKMLAGNYALTESFISGFEDLNDFLDQSSFFAENFLTEAERLAPVQKQVTEGLNALGLSAVKTKGQFAAVIRGLDLTTQTGQDTYTALLKLAPAFAQVAEAAGEAFDSIDSLYDITGRLSKINDEYLDLLKDQKSALTSTVDKLKSFIKTISDFRASLLLSNLSPLTPQQRYSEAKAQYESVLARVRTGDEDAMSKLQGAAQAFLTESQSFYASSVGYQNDFSAVQEALTASVDNAKSLLTDTEKQLNALTSQIGLLDSNNKILSSIERYAKEIGNILSKGFGMLDANLDGLLTFEELKAAGIASDTQIKNMISVLDSNGDGQISLLESIAAYTGSMDNSMTNFGTMLALLKEGKITGKQASSSAVESGIKTGTYVDIGGKKTYISSGGAIATDLGTTEEKLFGAKEGQVASLYEARKTSEKAYAEGGIAGLRNAAIDWGVDAKGLDDLMGWTEGTALAQAKAAGLPEFAVGTNFIPEDMPAIVHRGERIIPAADNRELMQALGSNSNQNLITEIQKLRAEVVNLQKQQQQQTGHLINATYDSQNKNAEQVAEAVTSATSVQDWAAKVKSKAVLV